MAHTDSAMSARQSWIGTIQIITATKADLIEVGRKYSQSTPADSGCDNLNRAYP